MATAHPSHINESSITGQFEIWFDNGSITSDSKVCTTMGFWTAMAVYDALCKNFLNVAVYNCDGVLTRSYDNR